MYPSIVSLAKWISWLEGKVHCKFYLYTKGWTLYTSLQWYYCFWSVSTKKYLNKFNTNTMANLIKGFYIPTLTPWRLDLPLGGHGLMFQAKKFEKSFELCLHMNHFNCMATIARALMSTNIKRARFSSNDRALLARCPIGIKICV